MYNKVQNTTKGIFFLNAAYEEIDTMIFSLLMFKKKNYDNKFDIFESQIAEFLSKRAKKVFFKERPILCKVFLHL